MPSTEQSRSELINKVIEALPGTPEEKEQQRRTLEADLGEPVRFIGIGQTGVGKTELLRSIFSIAPSDLSGLKELKTGAARATTKTFYSFTIES